MNYDELIEIGNHSFSHESLTLMKEKEALADYLRCEEVLGQFKRSSKVFAFPNGAYTESLIETFRSKGAEHILLVNEKHSSPSNVVHGRITFYADDLLEAKARALGLLT